MNTVITSRENILETCKKIVSNKGLTAINMRLVAKECNIALGSIYYYFPSKDELLIAIIESVWEDIFKWNDFEKKELNFLEFVEKLFLHIRINVDKYPNFFMIHSISLSENGKEKGYSKMTFYDLPQKFCIITFDDGYRSNYTEAYPLLKKYGLKATIFPVGKTMGLNKYPDTDKDIYEHFSAAEAKEMSDVIEFGSHTYWMHQAYPSDKYTFRRTAKRLPGESEETYVKAFKEDTAKYKALYKEFADGEPLVFAYPEGDFDGLSELIAEEVGYKVTLGVKPGKNYIVKGLPETLKKLKRINIDEKTDISEYE